MLKKDRLVILLIGIFALIFSTKVYAAANINTYTIKTDERNISTQKLINGGTVQYSKPSPVYDFFDENGRLNVIYTSEAHVYWAKFDENLKPISTIKMKQFYDKSNSIEALQDIIYTFGNAVYYEGHLFVVYGRESNVSTYEAAMQKYATMALLKYDKQGNVVAKLEMPAVENTSETDLSYGTYLPFFPNCNCSLTVNNGILACFFGKQMFNSHQASSVFFVDTDTLEWVSNRYWASDEDKEKYANVMDYYNSHSLAQRIIPTSDGGYLMLDCADASRRGLLVTKIYLDAEGNFQKETFKMLHYREGATGTHGYNNTYSIVGNVIELSDGYMYIGALEKTLSRSYGKEINESWNIMIQKYSKDFYTKNSIEEMQMFDTEVRKAVGIPSEYNGYGRLYLTGDEKDYGIKWLTDLKNEKTVIQLRAVELENDQIAILYELLDITESDTNGYMEKSDDGEVYYMIIDKDGNIISKPEKVPGVYLTPEEILAYKNGKIYWTSTEYGNNEITINVLDIKNPKLPFTDVAINDWYYSAVKYNYEKGMILGVNETTFAPNSTFTRAMLVTILHRMEGMPYVSGTSKFPDVQNTNSYYYVAVKWATKNGIVSGYANGKFGPDDPITREQLSVILNNYCRYKGKYKTVYANLNNYKDSNKISDFAKWSMNWAVGSGVITGTPQGYLNPQGTATRAEAASMLFKYCMNVK